MATNDGTFMSFSFIDFHLLSSVFIACYPYNGFHKYMKFVVTKVFKLQLEGTVVEERACGNLQIVTFLFICVFLTRRRNRSNKATPNKLNHLQKMPSSSYNDT